MSEPNLSLTNGTYGDLAVKGGLLMKRNKVVARPFNKELLIDVAARNSGNVATHAFLDTLAATAASAGLSVRYVEGFATYFDPVSRWKDFIKTGDAQGVELTADERAALDTVNKLKEKFTAAFTLPVPPYEFDPVPKGVDALANFKFSDKGRVTWRAHPVGKLMARKIWERAHAAWSSGSSGIVRINRLTIGGYWRDVVIYPDRIKIGCQTMYRYEAEALAKRLKFIA